jgi:hypothetical protein
MGTVSEIAWPVVQLLVSCPNQIFCRPMRKTPPGGKLPVMPGVRSSALSLFG